MIHADRRVSLFEFVIFTLRWQSPPRPPAPPKYKSLEEVRPEVHFLSLMACRRRRGPTRRRRPTATRRRREGSGMAGLHAAAQRPRLDKAGEALRSCDLAPIPKAVLVKASLRHRHRRRHHPRHRGRAHAHRGRRARLPLPPLLEETDLPPSRRNRRNFPRRFFVECRHVRPRARHETYRLLHRSFRIPRGTGRNAGTVDQRSPFVQGNWWNPDRPQRDRNIQFKRPDDGPGTRTTAPANPWYTAQERRADRQRVGRFASLGEREEGRSHDSRLFKPPSNVVRADRFTIDGVGANGRSSRSSRRR